MKKVNQPHAKASCGARTRSGGSCRNLPVGGRRRCRMHGGAHGSGAPLGNRNALKMGLHTAAAKVWRQRIRDLIRESKELIRDVPSLAGIPVGVPADTGEGMAQIGDEAAVTPRGGSCGRDRDVRERIEELGGARKQDTASGDRGHIGRFTPALEGDGNEKVA